MNVDQAREEWQAAGDYDSACRLIRAQAARIGQIELELVAERENNIGEFESRSEAEQKVRTLKAQVMGLERELADFKASQHYRYIGVDGKPVLAREIEDRAIKAEAALAAEKALADRLYRTMIYGDAAACLEATAAYREARGL